MMPVPEALKTHNWTLYENSMSPDPAIACQFVGKLITSLITTMIICGETKYDSMLAYESLGARRAWKEYNDGYAGQGMQTVTQVLSKVGFLLYDKEFANPQAKAFIGRT